MDTIRHASAALQMHEDILGELYGDSPLCIEHFQREQPSGTYIQTVSSSATPQSPALLH